jgi:DNA-directed RNA polymerase subunit E'/Rpb7
MSGPYITTILDTTVTLKPSQFDNRIYKNLKDNLIKNLEGKYTRSLNILRASLFLKIQLRQLFLLLDLHADFAIH